MYITEQIAGKANPFSDATADAMFGPMSETEIKRAAAIEGQIRYNRYKQRPDVIRHTDGVLEIPETEGETNTK